MGLESTVILGNGDGTFQPELHCSAVPNPPSGNPNTISQAAGDLNGDGKLDLILVNNSLGTVSVLMGDGDGHRSPLFSGT